MRRVIVDIDDYGGEIAYCLEEDGIPYDYNEIANSKVKKVREEFINKYPKNYMGEPELGGRSCVFSLNEVLDIINKHLSEVEE